MQHVPVRRSWIFIAALLALSVPSNSAPSVRGGATTAPAREDLRLADGLSRWLDADRDRVGKASPSTAAQLRAQWHHIELVELAPRREDRAALLRKLPYGEQICDIADANGLDPLLIAAIVEAESRFKPDRVSPRGAMGLMQVMSSTFDLYGGQGNPLDPRFNLEIGTRYFRTLLERFDGDLELALAAYNAGPNCVARYGGVPPYPETRGYVEKVLTAYLDHQRRLAVEIPLAD